ncbi:hypothetical protein TNCV_3931761 [Trichonephila clavipes]|nr:hypothetical protein TNCV_3931761 [Trichonephila clavipes]
MLLNSNGRVNWDNVRFAIKPPVIVGLPYKACVSFSINPLTSFFIRDGYKHASTHFHSCLVQTRIDSLTSPVIVGLPYKACVSFSISPLTPFFIRDGYKHTSTQFSLVLGS